MSVETKTALDLALAAHIADITDGSYLTDYFTITASTETEDFGTGRTVYCFTSSDNQPAHVAMGLLAYAADFGQINLEEDDDD